MGFAQDDSAVRGTKEKYPFVGIAPCYKSSCCQVLPKLRISKDIPHDSFRVFPCLERSTTAASLGSFSAVQHHGYREAWVHTGCTGSCTPFLLE